MTPSTELSPTIIRAESSADFLALLPALTGYTVTNSLLIVLFSGNRIFGALRFDLPPSDDPRIGAELAASVAGGVRQIANVDGVAVAIMTDLRSGAHGGLPWRNLARRLERKITRAGLVLRDSCCVAADGWSSYITPEPGRAMRPLSEITQSVAGLEASLITDEPITGLAQMGALPLQRLERAAEVRHALDEVLARPSRLAFTGPRIGALITGNGAHPTAKDAARITYAAASLAGWLRLVCATRESGVVGSTSARDRHAESLGSTDEANYLADCFDRDGTFDRPEEATQPCGPIEHALVLFAGVQPDRERSRRAITLIGEIAAHVSLEHQPGLRCLLAWMWWWTGLASVATRHLEEALKIEPEHQIAIMLGRIIDDGMIPPWAFTVPPAGR